MRQEVVDSAPDAPTALPREPLGSSRDERRPEAPAFRSHPDEIAYLTGDRSIPPHYEGTLFVAASAIRQLSLDIETRRQVDPVVVSQQLRQVELLLQQLL